MSFGVRATAFGSVYPGGLLGRAPEIVRGLAVFIAGQDLSEKIALESFALVSELQARDTCEFSFFTRDVPIEVFVGSPVRIVINTEVVFGGRVQSIERQSPADSGAIIYTLRCSDWNALADEHIVTAKFEEGKPAGSIVADILDTYSGDPGETLFDDGVEINGPSVQAGPDLGVIVFDGQTVTECLDELAELIGFFWNIDPEKVLYFIDPQTFVAPFPLDEAVFPYFERVRVSSSRGEYRNVVTLRGGYDETNPYDEINTFKGDGENDTFTLRLEVSVPVISDAEQPPIFEVSLNGGAFAVQTAAIQGADEDAQWFYKIGSDTVSQNSNGTKLTSVDKLRVTYTGRFPIIGRGRNEAQIAIRKAIESSSSPGRLKKATGVSERVEDDNNINDAGLAEEKISALLRRFGRIREQIEFFTPRPGFRIGQLLSVNLPEFGINAEYLIESVNLRFLGFDENDEEVFEYVVSAIEGELFGGWTQFYKDLSKKGRPFVIRENENLLLLRALFEELSLSDLISFEEPLGSFIDDKLSVMLTGSAMGVRRTVSPNSNVIGYYAGPRIGNALHPTES